MKNPYKKGELIEKDFSLEFHRQGIPLLISSLVLRSRGAGQVDLGRLEKKMGQCWIHLLEIKAGQNVSLRQKNRLKKSGQFLGCLLGFQVKFSYVLGRGLLLDKGMA